MKTSVNSSGKISPAKPMRYRIGGLSAVLFCLGGFSLGVSAGEAGLQFEPQVAVGGPAVMRRLTESQYRASVAAIFGADIPVVGRFEPGLRSHGLIAVGTGESGLSPFSIEQYDASSRSVAAAVVSEQRRDRLLPCKPESETLFDEPCTTLVVNHYGHRLFRRPLQPAETQRFVEAARGAHKRLNNFYSGLEYALAGIMVSPEFLLRIERVEPDPERPGKFRLDAWSRATRLSYLLTGSTPDEELLRAVATGEFETTAGLTRQADRLIASPAFESAIRAFFEDMLQFDLFEDHAKDPLIYPAFNSVVAADAQEQTLRTIVDLLLTRQGDYRDLFTTRTAYLTRALGIIYRVPVATRNGWLRTQFSERSGRAGIQANISFLALHSHPGRSSPTLRGEAIREVFMCQPMPDPPVDVDFTGINDTANAAMPTARDRLVAHRNQPVCAACHILMDPPGLTLEHFDGLGAFRSRENGALIDVSGSLDGREIEAATGLGQALHDHREIPRCLVRNMYRYAVGRETAPGEQPYLAYLDEVFAAGDYRLQDLVRTIALSNTFYAVAPPVQEAGTEQVVGVEVRKGDQS